MTDSTTFELAVRVVRAVPAGVRKLALDWLKFFWRLSIVGKIAVTGGEIVILWVILQRVPLSPGTRASATGFGALVLAFLLVIAVLFAAPRRN